MSDLAYRLEALQKQHDGLLEMILAYPADQRQRWSDVRGDHYTPIPITSHEFVPIQINAGIVYRWIVRNGTSDADKQDALHRCQVIQVSVQELRVKSLTLTLDALREANGDRDPPISARLASLQDELFEWKHIVARAECKGDVSLPSLRTRQAELESKIATLEQQSRQ